MYTKVVIFEDVLMLREMLVHFINESHGYICTGAYSDALNVIPKIRKSDPDIILMDIEMPGINGIEAMKLIKAHFPTKLIIMQTAIDDDDTIFDAICAGASGYLLKNTSPAKLLDALTEVSNGGSPMSPSVARKVLEKFSSVNNRLKKTTFELSERELEILGHLVNGLGYKTIADACCISFDTVKFHVKKIYEKLQVSSKAEAVAKAFRSGLV
ncbi:MAG: response regulator transcription factor [Bacteroidetes bacterium]|nr:response regulator transcription factor [Bacteroidota bacterium]